jgi:membrane peptidoglycan carboxypeptidase
MQTALQRRQRHRRNGAARRGRGGGAARRAALAIPLLLFSSFLVLGSVGLVGAVSAYAYYSKDLPDHPEKLYTLGYEKPTYHYDHNRKVKQARFGVLKRELVKFEDIPPELIDATTSVEDKDFWSNPGFDIGAVVSAALDTLAGRPRGASTITQQLVRARLLPASAFEGTVYDRKIREIIQSIRLTQAFKGEDGKKDIITAYLNQNFYGNQSYGVKAAAFGYFGKDLPELTLAQYAILAAIPQSPTANDLMANAIRECSVEIAEDAQCPADKVTLRVPDDSPIVLRRNHVLDLMADPTKSVLSGQDHTAAEYEAAKSEPVILTPTTRPDMKAPHFVLLVRHELGALLCGEEKADSCEAADTGGYQITTTLDYKMQQTVEKWLYAAARVTHLKSPATVWKRLGISDADVSWLRNLRTANIHNGASAILDYRTGQVLAYAGSAGFYLNAEGKVFQPQYDVLTTGFRQPGSAIKPFNYITGIENRTLTASTMFMDVVTELGSKGDSYTPKNSDSFERGPIRLRTALQFSMNVPSIKAGIIQGLDLVLNKEKEFGLEFYPGSKPVPAQSVGVIETHPIDMVSAYGAIANGGVLMPRETILEVRDKDGKVVYPLEGDKAVGKRVVSPQAAFIVADILQGNTDKKINPIWGRWQIIDKAGAKDVRRPAAFKTGTTDDRKDVHAYGFLAPPDDPAAPAIVVGVWMGNSDATPNLHGLSFESSAPTWSRILTEVSQGLPIAKFKRPDGIVEVEVDAFSGLLPGPGTVSKVKEIFIEGTEPTRKDNLHVEAQIDQATGLLWQDGCTGPMVTRTFLDFSNAEERFPQWQPYTQAWAERAARGVGVKGGPDGTRTMYFYNTSFHPFGATWGGKFKPTEVCAAQVNCPPGVNPTPDPSTGNLPCIPEPSPSHGNPNDTPAPTGPQPTKPGNSKPTPTPTVPPPTTAPAQATVVSLAVMPVFAPFAPFALFAIGRRVIRRKR